MAVRDEIIKRVIEIANYMIATGNTVRRTANVFGVSKSTVHKDCSERLLDIDPYLYTQVKKILDINLSERHIRGGEATRKKYK